MGTKKMGSEGILRRPATGGDEDVEGHGFSKKGPEGVQRKNEPEGLYRRGPNGLFRKKIAGDDGDVEGHSMRNRGRTRGE